MPTNKTRINVSVADDVGNALSLLARRDRIPRATKAARLLEFALEVEEDQLWDARASVRDTKRVRYVPHSQAWK